MHHKCISAPVVQASCTRSASARSFALTNARTSRVTNVQPCGSKEWNGASRQKTQAPPSSAFVLVSRSLSCMKCIRFTGAYRSTSWRENTQKCVDKPVRGKTIHLTLTRHVWRVPYAGRDAHRDSSCRLGVSTTCTTGAWSVAPIVHACTCHARPTTPQYRENPGSLLSGRYGTRRALHAEHVVAK
jgi:hypothetical protein